MPTALSTLVALDPTSSRPLLCLRPKRALRIMKTSRGSPRGKGLLLLAKYAAVGKQDVMARDPTVASVWIWVSNANIHG